MHPSPVARRAQCFYTPSAQLIYVPSRGLCRGPEHPEGLRRLVVKVGTAGGSNSHQLVYRCMQGLFREVGLSPNFIWDGTFDVPDKYLTFEHRQALEEARLDAKVQGIQAIHKGKHYHLMFLSTAT